LLHLFSNFFLYSIVFMTHICTNDKVCMITTSLRLSLCAFMTLHLRLHEDSEMSSQTIGAQLP
jgi:hypothetical protein